MVEDNIIFGVSMPDYKYNIHIYAHFGVYIHIMKLLETDRHVYNLFVHILGNIPANS